MCDGADMNLELQAKRAIVTAASGGRGYATALALAREGASVALCSRDGGRANGAAEGIARETGAAIHALAADVDDADSPVKCQVEKTG